jgi:hypothetical protein
VIRRKEDVVQHKMFATMLYVCMYVVEGVEEGEGACSCESSDGLTGGGALNKLSCKETHG